MNKQITQNVFVSKNYRKWLSVKIRTQNAARPSFFRAGEIWWCIIGENIGSEMDGAGENFIRPVLIVHKFGKNTFLGIPMTSKTKKVKRYYYPIIFSGKSGTLVLSQIRTWDAKRLISEISFIPEKSLEKIRHYLKIFLHLN